jgi:alpha-tubulin suppressor-like RCC1 family protein
MKNFYLELVAYLVKDNLDYMISSIEMPKKHCTAIIHDKKIMSIGFNRYKTSKIAVEFGYRYGEYHAELDALINVHSEICQISPDKLTMVNFRLNRFRQIGISRPCAKCLSWSLETFANMVYTDVDGGLTIECSRTGDKERICNAEQFQSKLGGHAEVRSVLQGC